MIGLRFHITSPMKLDLGYTGRPLRSWFLKTVQDFDPELSSEMHAQQTIRDFVVVPLPHDNHFKTHFNMGSEYTFGVRLLRKKRFVELLKHILNLNYLELRLHNHVMPIRAVDYSIDDPHELMNQWISSPNLDDASAVRIRMAFNTPVQLSKSDTDALCMFPLPEKVFPSILRIWQDLGYTGFRSIEEYVEWVLQNVYVARHKTKTVPIRMGPHLTVIGFVGKVEYLVHNTESIPAKMTVGLSKYSELCNLGKHRTAGLGSISTQVFLEEESGAQSQLHFVEPAYQQ